MPSDFLGFTASCLYLQGMMFFKLCLATLCLCASAVAAEEILADLNPKQTAILLKGEPVSVQHDIPNLPWPKVVVYRLVHATPEEVAAIFFDYKNAKSFIPNLLKSEVSLRRSAQDHEVDYVLDVPLLPDEAYTARNRLASVEDGVYFFDWNLVRATSTKASLGNLRIEPRGKGALMRYTNLVTPNSGMAGLLRSVAVDQMNDTVEALVRRVEKQKSTNPLELQRRVKELRAALLET